jgi:hypothetical protein
VISLALKTKKKHGFGKVREFLQVMPSDSYTLRDEDLRGLLIRAGPVEPKYLARSKTANKGTDVKGGEAPVPSQDSNWSMQELLHRKINS